MSAYETLLGHRTGAFCCLCAWLLVGCSGGRAPGDGSSAEGYSPLDAINESNVEPLSLTWAYEAEVAFTGAPAVVDGVVYADADGLGVHAVSADIGRRIWHFDAKVPEAALLRPEGGEGRGVAVRDGRVYFAARDDRLIALDGATGAPVWESGICADCGEGARRVAGAPRVAGDHIVVAMAGAEGAAGHLIAFDAGTGKEVWRFTEPASETGAGTSWGGMIYDTGLRLLYVSATGASPSLRGFDPQNGRAVWEYPLPQAQGRPGAANGHLLLADLTIEGVARRAIMHAHPDGHFHVLDRADGKRISVSRFAGLTGAHLGHSPNFRPKAGLAYLPVDANGERYLMAWNPVSGKEQWRIVLEESTPCGGLLSTAGNLLVQGDSEGYLNVFEAEWGEVRARAPIDACAAGAPFSYSVEGVQYIATLAPAAAAGARGGRILALELGGGEVKSPRIMRRFPKTIRPEQESS
jgi:glucose dehydrogenase